MTSERTKCSTDREEYLVVNGCSTFVRRRGAGEPVLFLHGFQTHHAWPDALSALAERFDVIMPDHPSFGRSATPEWLASIADLAFLYLDFLERLDLRNVHLVGHCLGGWIAAEIAIRSTARLKTLTLVSPAGLRIKDVPRADIFMADPEALASLTFSDHAEELRSDWLAGEESSGSFQKNRLAAARLSWQPRFYSPDLAKWLHRIDVPTHIIWGDSDKVIPSAYAQAFAKEIPKATVSLQTRCGHIPYVESPVEFASLASGFIERSVS